MLDVKPLSQKVVGRLMERGRQSSVLWTPNDDTKESPLLRVLHVGEDCDDIEPGDLLLLHHNWSGGELAFADDETGEHEEYHVVHLNDCLARIKGV